MKLYKTEHTSERTNILTFSKLLKYGLQALRTILCAFICLPSQASVMSTKSSSSLKDSNAEVILVWKLFHRRQNCWSAPILAPLHLVYYLKHEINEHEIKKQLSLFSLPNIYFHPLPTYDFHLKSSFTYNLSLSMSKNTRRVCTLETLI